MTFRILRLVLVCFIFNSCLESFEPETVTFENALVIEATITNELKQQEVFLSRTFRFEEEGASAEQNADVMVVDDAGNAYDFQETSPGTYMSTTEFTAQAGRSYQLNITTNNGRSYTSQSTPMTDATQIDNLYVERIMNDNGVEGMGIFVDSFDPSGNSKNYRYEYEETYRIIAPNWTPQDLAGDPEGGCGLIIVPREREEQICYTTDFSNSIILTNTNGFTEDKVARFLVRFINRDNYIISHRYSVLVRQFVQSSEAYAFFEALGEFSGSESIFSETQPGFLAANIVSNDNESEKTLGYFDVASVSERRIFFNYEDFFPNEDLPPYIDPCAVNAPLLTSAAIPPQCILRTIVENNLVRYFNNNGSPKLGEGPFFVVSRVCGDCTVLGETIIPEFWIEE